MKLPYFPLFVANYEADTRHLTLEEDGCYIRLLRLCWKTPSCSIPNDPIWIRRQMIVTAKEYDKVVASILDEFFKLSRGRFSQKRLTIEYKRIISVQKKRSDAGKKGGRPSNAQKTNNIDKSQVKAKQKHLDLDEDQELDKKKEPKGSKKPAPVNRIQENWYPSENGLSVARDYGFSPDEIKEEVDEFKTYWSDRRDRDSRKSERGWNNTWRNRIKQKSGFNSQYAGSNGRGGSMVGGSHNNQGGPATSIADEVLRRKLARKAPEPVSQRQPKLFGD